MFELLYLFKNFNQNQYLQQPIFINVEVFQPVGIFKEGNHFKNNMELIACSFCNFAAYLTIPLFLRLIKRIIINKKFLNVAEAKISAVEVKN
jgi:hypothetical protein